MFKRRSLILAVFILSSALGVGCAGGDDQPDEADRAIAAQQRRALNGADTPGHTRFPEPTRGQSLQEFADAIGVTGANVGLATSVFTPGHNRIAFGLIDAQNQFVYGPTAIYVARTPSSTRIVGPYRAPADLLVTEPAFRSEQAATESSPVAAIYEVGAVELEKPGDYVILALTWIGQRYVAAPARITVTRRGGPPRPGELAPVIDTDTVTAAAGEIASIDTRRPTDDMHSVNFRDVVGKKPIALLFATPQLCHSRVCGPVVDIALQLKQRYGDRVQFIHQEVYVDNNANKGLRPQLKRFGLPTEPWLFVIDSRGRVAARLEGSFGLNAMERAVKVGIAAGQAG